MSLFLLVCALLLVTEISANVPGNDTDSQEDESCDEALERTDKELRIAVSSISSLTTALGKAEKEATQAEEDLNLAIFGTRILYDNETKEYDAVMCEWKGTQVSCHDQKKIKITYADYGRHDRKTCLNSEIYTTNCSSNKTMPYVMKTCEGKTSCRLVANFRRIGEDPCVNTYKYLRVKYKCVEST